MQKIYYTAAEVAEMLGCSLTKSYAIIRQLNEELTKQGYIVLAGKVPIAYFKERYYGLA